MTQKTRDVGVKQVRLVFITVACMNNLGAIYILRFLLAEFRHFKCEHAAKAQIENNMSLFQGTLVLKIQSIYPLRTYDECN